MCRPDFAANVAEKDVSVTTPYGRIRGFYVHLFDGPGVPIGDRPGANYFRKLWRTVSTFLGIPYAMPPVNEGRFKVILHNNSCILLDFIFLILNLLFCLRFILSLLGPNEHGVFGMP